MAKPPANPADQREFADLNDAQLQELATRSRQAMHDRFASRVEELRVYARQLGLQVSVTSIGETKTSPRRARRKAAGESGATDDRRASVTAKYRNPDDDADTWSGRGRPPLWYKEKIAAGATEESLLIQPERQSAAEIG
jgi:DNA-binding protein H-NS